MSLTLTELIFQIIRGLLFLTGAFLLILIGINGVRLFIDWQSTKIWNVQIRKQFFIAICWFILILILSIIVPIISRIFAVSTTLPMPLPRLET